MRFGPIAAGEAEGAILAHAVKAGDRLLRKAARIGADDVAALKAAGIASVIAAVLEEGDVGEDTAAETIGSALLTDGVEVKPASTGRVNLHAAAAGVFQVDASLIDRINGVDPAVTIATLADHVRVVAGQMVATVKIIPFAVADGVLGRVLAIAGESRAFTVHPFRSQRVCLIQTVLPATKASVLDKTVHVTEERLARSGSVLADEMRLPHEIDAVAEAIREAAGRHDMVVVFGASAMSDPEDVVPAAIRAAGGTVLRAGMPVDPGNLIVLAELGGKPVLGAPGCARSPKENGFDWVLDRLSAAMPVGERDLSRMGVGGLLMEIPTRPQPREVRRLSSRPQVHAVVLAAGRSSRMGGPNKLLALFDGEPLIRRTVSRTLDCRAVGTVVVTGHQADRIEAALAGLDLRFARNADYASGLSGSLKAGIASLPKDAVGALVILGDMPEIDVADLDRLIAAFGASGGAAVVRATHGGKRGNPVILPSTAFAAVVELEGDTGARHIVEAGGYAVIDVEIGAGAGVDVDTPDALKRAGGVLQE